jgi:hypothetical protein
VDLQKEGSRSGRIREGGAVAVSSLGRVYGPSAHTIKIQVGKHSSGFDATRQTHARARVFATCEITGVLAIEAALRRSLTKQIVQEYLKLTGKKLPLHAIGKRVVVSVADPVVARLMTVRALLDLLDKGDAGEKAKVPIERAPFALPRSRVFGSFG